MGKEKLSWWDQYFIKWWGENKDKFSTLTKNKELSDHAVKRIAGLEYLLKDFDFKINDVTSYLLHGYFSAEEYQESNNSNQAE